MNLKGHPKYEGWPFLWEKYWPFGIIFGIKKKTFKP